MCELLGLFLLHHLSLLLGKEAVRLHQDGLAIISNSSGLEADKTRKQVEKIFQQHNLKVTKQVEKIFQQHNLKVTAKTNPMQTDFPDVIIKLNTENFSPLGNAMTIPSTSMFDPTTLLQSPNTYP